MKKQDDSGFNMMLFHALYKGLNSIGTSIPPAILSYLKKEGSVGSDQTVHDPKALDRDLQKIFGFGAKVIEKKILEVLNAELRISTGIEDNFNFAEKVLKIQKKYSLIEVDIGQFEAMKV